MHHSRTARVSVVIPCYGQAHFLGEAIESVLAQSHPHREIVVVDDGSPDPTAEVAARYPGVRCVRQSNQGLSAARNAGFGASTGEYVVFLDADDRLLPNALAAGLRRFETHPECAFVAGRYQSIAADGSPLEDTHEALVEEDHYRRLLRRNYIVVPAAVLYRRRVLEQVGGFDPSVNAAADYDLYLRIARDHPIHCYEEAVAEYRQHGASMSRKSVLMLRTVLAVLGAQWDHLRADPQLRRDYRDGVRSWREYYGEQLAHEVRLRVRSRSGGVEVIRNIALLLRHYPRGLAGHVTRKLRAVASGRRDPLPPA